MKKILSNVYYYYPAIVQVLFKITGILYNVIQSVITSIGALVILTALVIVEHHRFSLAISFFESEPLYVFAGAAFLVMAILFTEIQIVVTDNQHGYQEQERNRFSLRFLFEDIIYFLGLSRNFTPQPKPPSTTIRFLRNFLIVSVMILAAIGSLKEEIVARNSMSFFDGIIDLTLNANFEVGSTVIAVMIFTFVSILLSTNAISNITKRAIEVLEDVQAHKQRVDQETKQENEKFVHKVKDLTPIISRSLSKYARNSYILDGDLVNLSINDFYDSASKTWLRDGNGYKSQTTLIKNIEKVLAARKVSRGNGTGDRGNGSGYEFRRKEAIQLAVDEAVS